jgi:hypothetical protein
MFDVFGPGPVVFNITEDNAGTHLLGFGWRTQSDASGMRWLPGSYGGSSDAASATIIANGEWLSGLLGSDDHQRRVHMRGGNHLPSSSDDGRAAMPSYFFILVYVIDEPIPVEFYLTVETTTVPEDSITRLPKGGTYEDTLQEEGFTPFTLSVSTLLTDATREALEDPDSRAHTWHWQLPHADKSSKNRPMYG